MNVLHIESSLFADQGVSSQLTKELLRSLEAKHGQLSVTQKSFAKEPVPHFDGDVLQAIMTPEGERSDSQQRLATYADQQIAEVQAADILVIGMPMYNFSVPSMLKAWFDYIARAGVTFRYTENGPEGLLTGKKVLVVTTRGGQYKDQPADSQVPFVKTFLSFLGMNDVEFIFAEGLNMGDDAKENGLREARKRIEALTTA